MLVNHTFFYDIGMLDMLDGILKKDLMYVLQFLKTTFTEIIKIVFSSNLFPVFFADLLLSTL